jgi:hypothetical protein
MTPRGIAFWRQCLETAVIAACLEIEVRCRYESFEYITSTDEFRSFWEPCMG